MKSIVFWHVSPEEPIREGNTLVHDELRNFDKSLQLYPATAMNADKSTAQSLPCVQHVALPCTKSPYK
jgi:hypothetical protein